MRNRAGATDGTARRAGARRLATLALTAVLATGTAGAAVAVAVTGSPAPTAPTTAVPGAGPFADPFGDAEATEGGGSAPCRVRLALGLFTPGQPNTTTGLQAFEQALGRPADVALTFTSFVYPFNVPALRGVAEAGRLPMITLEPWDPNAPGTNPYSLQDIAAGAHDAYLKAQAARLRELGHPVAVRFAHEMNGSWYPWGHGVQGNTPADYVAAYRHVHDLVSAEGGAGVRWVWSPATLDGPSIADPGAFYPGDDYVDWVGLSVYYDQPTDTWARSFAPTVTRLAEIAPRRPLFLAESGVLPGVDRPAKIRDLVDNLARTPHAIGLTWFEVASRQDWRILQEPDSLTSLRTGLAAANAPATGPVPASPTPCFALASLGTAPLAGAPAADAS